MGRSSMPAAAAVGRFIVTRDARGRWLVHDVFGQCGGIFVSEDGARRFARDEERAHAPLSRPAAWVRALRP